MPVKVVESNLNVLQAAKIRIRNVFANGCKIYLGFSSGKDSLCMANLVYEMILSGELDPKQLTVTFIDEEGLYPSMVDAAYRWRRNFLSVGAKFLWFCLPFKQVSVIDHLSSSESWITWEPGKEDVWMRKPPDFAIMYSPYLHYAGEMNYQTFCSKAFSDGIQLVGLRTAESLTRFKCIANTKMERITRGGKFYPIYDWKDSDVWLYIKERNLEFPEILHIMESERPDQYRGVPLIAPIIEPLLQLRRYTESELLAALVQSFFTAWIVTDTPKNAIPFDETGSGDLGGVPVDNPKADNASHSPNEYEMGPGTVAHLGKGEDIKFGNPNIPTAGFDTFVKTLCKLMGGAIEMPYELLLKEFNASYSASRASLLEAWEGIKMRRAWLVGSFCQPVYEIWLSEAVARGRVIAPGFFDDPLVRAAWCGARWIGPVQGTLDPKKEVEAAVLQTHHGFRTHEQVTRELGGGDWEDNVAELAHENEQLKAAGSEGVIETTESVTTQGGKENAESTE